MQQTRMGRGAWESASDNLLFEKDFNKKPGELRVYVRTVERVKA